MKMKTKAYLIYNGLGNGYALKINGQYLSMTFYTQKEAYQYCKRHNLVMKR